MQGSGIKQMRCSGLPVTHGGDLSAFIKAVLHNCSYAPECVLHFIHNCFAYRTLKKHESKLEVLFFLKFVDISSSSDCAHLSLTLA